MSKNAEPINFDVELQTHRAVATTNGPVGMGYACAGNFYMRTVGDCRCMNCGVVVEFDFAYADTHQATRKRGVWSVKRVPTGADRSAVMALSR